MKRIALALLLIASPAWAVTATRFVTVTGAGGHDGLALGSAWNLTEANANAAADMRIIMAAGDYSATDINPATGTTGTTRIAFLPTATSAVDSTIIVKSIKLNVPGVTVRGIKSVGTATMDGTANDVNHYARSDSVVACVIGDDMNFYGAKACTFYGNVIHGGANFVNNGGIKLEAVHGGVRFTDSCLVRANTFYGYLTADACGGGCHYRYFGLWSASHNTIDSNTVNFTVTFSGFPSDGPVMLWIANSSYNAFRSNHWRFTTTNTAQNANGDYVGHEAFYFRDSSSANIMQRDTMDEVGGTQRYKVLMSGSGKPEYSGKLHDNLADYCVWRTGGTFQFQDFCTSWALTNNVIASSGGTPLSFTASTVDSFTIRHNSIFAGGGQVLESLSGAAQFTNSSIYGNLYLSSTGGTTCSASSSPLRLWDVPIGSDYNAVWSYVGSSGNTVRTNGGVCKTVAAWGLASGNDAHSFFQDPLVTDTTWATLNLTPASSASPLWQAYLPGGYAGAYPNNTFTITATAVGGGSITPSGASSIAPGNSIIYEMDDAGFKRLAQITVDGVNYAPGGGIGGAHYWPFPNVSANHTIVASFSSHNFDPPPNPPTVTPTPDGLGWWSTMPRSGGR